MDENEVWTAIPGFEGRYEVSSLGRVRSMGFYSNNRYGTRTWRAGRVLKATIVPHTGYRAVTLVDEQRQHSIHRVHRLVLLAFIGPPPPGKPNGLHSDDNKLNNRLTNLRWGTHSDNNFDSVDNGSHAQARKQACDRGHLYVSCNVRNHSAAAGLRGCQSCHMAQINVHRDGLLGRPRTRYNRGKDGFRRQAGETWEQEADRRYEHLKSIYPHEFGLS